jgi:transcriptional regulator GlxA family with amidase domain
VASVCTGAFLLAATGILDGRRVATHWAWCDRLADRHPRLRVDPNPIFVVDGDVWTSAGITAGIDMALAMLEADLGRDLALAVARRLVMFLKRPGGQAQFSTTLALQRGGRFEELHAWIRANLARDLRLPALARQAGMSERNLLRRYRQAVGATPARTVERLRVEAACRQLGDTARGVKEVARACGFGSEETMRRSFLRQLEVTPQAWRERFAAPLKNG